MYYSTGLTKQSGPSAQQMEGNSHERHIGILIEEGHSLVAVSAIIRAFRIENKLMPIASGQRAYRVSLLSRLGGHVMSSSTITVCTHSLAMYSPSDFHALFVANHDMRSMTGSGTWLSLWLTKSDLSLHDRDRSTECGGIDPTSSAWLSLWLPKLDGSVHDRDRGPRSCDIEPTSSPRSTIPVFWFGDAGGEEYGIAKMAAQVALDQIASDHTDEISTRMNSTVSPLTEMIVKPRSDDLRPRAASIKIRESCRWIKENFGNDISVSVAASVAAMSVRNYVRRFKNECGVTPLEYLMRIRFEAVCAMLVETDLPFDKIGRHCGLGSGDRMGRLFRKRNGMSPTAYRELHGNKTLTLPPKNESFAEQVDSSKKDDDKQGKLDLS